MGVQNASACELSTVTCTVTSRFLLPIGDFIVQGSREILCQQAQHGVHTSVFKVFATCFLNIQSHKKVAIVVVSTCVLFASQIYLLPLSHALSTENHLDFSESFESKNNCIYKSQCKILCEKSWTRDFIIH